MRNKSNTKEWQEFEKLIALIESHLVPKGAVIKSPDFIDDKVTGKSRQIDASIRYQVGSVPILIIIESRHRKSIEDTTWIEQLVQKQKDVGANASIAVSSRKFSKPALKKAKFYNIETRLLNEIEEDAIRDWADKLETVVFRGVFQLKLMKISLFNNSIFSFNPSMEKEFKEKGIEFKFIHINHEGIKISIKDLLLQNENQDVKDKYPKQVTVEIPPKTLVQIPVNSKFENLFTGVPLNGEAVSKFLRWEFAFSEATILGLYGNEEIKYLDVEIQMMYKAYPANIRRFLSYRDDVSKILNVEERNIDFENGESLNILISGKP